MTTQKTEGPADHREHDRPRHRGPGRPGGPGDHRPGVPGRPGGPGPAHAVRGWTLGDLIGHMTVQHYGWTAAAAGHGADLSCWQPGPPAADPVREYAAAAGRVLEAFGDDGVLGREFALAELSPVLRFPAAQAIGFHFIDYLVHGWDVARSLGLAYQPEADVLAAALPVAQAVPDGELRKQGLVPFAPGRPVSAQAACWTRSSPCWAGVPPGQSDGRAMRLR